MSTELRDGLMLVVALFTVVASVYYYVAGVLQNDRLVSRSAMGLFVLFGLVAAGLIWRVLS